MPQHYDLILPDLGLGPQPIHAGMWLVRRGDWVAEGEAILEVVAGNVLVELSARHRGILRKKLVAVDQVLTAGQRLAVIEQREPPSGGQDGRPSGT